MKYLLLTLIPLVFVLLVIICMFLIKKRKNKVFHKNQENKDETQGHIYEKDDRHMSDKEIIKRVFPYFLPHLKKLCLVLALMLVTVIIGLLVTVLPGYVTSSLSSLVKNDSLKWQDMYPVVFLSISITLIYILNSFLSYIIAISLQKIGQNIIFNLRQIVFKHINQMAIEKLNEIPVGSLVTRVVSDTNTLSNLFTNTFVNIVKNLFMLFSVIFVMFAIDYRIASILMSFLPVILVLSYFFRKVIRKNYRKVRHSYSSMNAFLNENISGMKITQIFNQEKQKEKEFDRLNDTILKYSKRDISLFATYRPLITFLFYVALALVFGVGSYLCLKDGIVSLPLMGNFITLSTIGVIQIFYSLVSKFFNPIQNLSDQLNNLQRAFTSCERLFNILDLKEEDLENKDAIEIENFKGEIEFRNVWFAYKDEDWILKDVSFHILPKQVVAFVGATGAGKTTILQLIVRNYDIQKGEILIDGIDIKKIKITSLRKRIGQMLQDVFLFSGTIASNISLNDEEIKIEDIRKACSYVNADKFIEKLPNKLDELVNEGGNNFSSGERQLLSFARTVVHSPQILILDEATSNIDTETEKLIQDSLQKLMNLGTMLIVAHRLSTIRNADTIICLKKGKIVEIGNHQELLLQKGYYYNLYQLQYQDQEEN